jgi:hypothetical protein
MAGGIGGAGGASGGLGSIGGFSGGFGSIGADAGASNMSIAAQTPTDFAQAESDSAAASSSSANAQVSTSFDASASTSDFGSNMAMLGASGPAEPVGGADVNQWKPQRPEEESASSVAMQPSDDVLAQVCAAYSANQM